MKIVLPVHHFPPHHNAGAELYTLRLALGLQKQGHTVCVVCIEDLTQWPSDTLTAESDTDQGVTVWRLRLNIPQGQEALRWSYRHPLLHQWFTEFLQQTSPDVVHAQGGYLIGIVPLEAAAQLGIPSVLTLHDYWFLCPRITLQQGDGTLCWQVPDNPAACAWCTCLTSRRYRIPDKLSLGQVGRLAQQFLLTRTSNAIAERRANVLDALRLPEAVLAPSRFLAQRFIPFVEPERLRVSPLGLDLTPFDRVPRRSADGTLRIGYIGQIAAHKGVHLLIDAFRQLRPGPYPIELHIYGGLQAQASYAAMLQQRSGKDARIQFHGRVPNTDIPEILANLDALVVPSVWFENSPLTIMEAQAAGTPVVTAALGGMAELVRDEVDGLLFRPTDSGDLARQLQRLIDQPDLLSRLRAAVQAPRSVEHEIAQLIELYEQVVTRAVACSQR